MQEPSPWSGEEGANGADRNTRPEWINTFFLHLQPGLKKFVLAKDYWGSIPRQATGVGATCYWRRK